MTVDCRWWMGSLNIAILWPCLLSVTHSLLPSGSAQPPNLCASSISCLPFPHFLHCHTHCNRPHSTSHYTAHGGVGGRKEERRSVTHTYCPAHIHAEEHSRAWAINQGETRTPKTILLSLIASRLAPPSHTTPHHAPSTPVGGVAGTTWLPTYFSLYISRLTHRAPPAFHYANRSFAVSTTAARHTLRLRGRMKEDINAKGRGRRFSPTWISVLVPLFYALFCRLFL